MKSLLLTLAASVGFTTAAFAQTSAPLSAPRTTTAASPNAVPSGMSPSNTTNSAGGVDPGEVFTKGAPENQKMRDKREMKQNKTNRKGKMKSNM